MTDVRVKAQLPAGFRDTTPADMILKKSILSVLVSVFERFGFEPFSSATVHFLDVLFGPGEDTEMAYWATRNTVRRERVGQATTGLKFDQTVPLGRFVAQHYQELPRPFLRYEIGDAFRGEAPTATRFSQFTQCDVDVVFAPDMVSDAQIIALMDTVIRELDVGTHLILLNNRKILDGLPAFVGFEARYLQPVLTVLDKKDKLEVGETLEGELAKLRNEQDELLLSELQIIKLLSFCNVSGSNEKKLAQIRSMLFESESAQSGCDELDQLLSYTRAFGMRPDFIQIEPSMVRGLGYYTGPIFETVLTDSPETGSIFSGGRYDKLVERFVDMPAPATGAAFGLDRFMVYAKQKGLFSLPASVVKVMVCYMDTPGCRLAAIQAASELRRWNLNTMLYDGVNTGFRPQLGRAKMLGIPWVILIGEDEIEQNRVQLKNMRDRTPQRTLGLIEACRAISEIT